jgi:hypothetical protein
VKLFLSYRRGDTQHFTGRLAERLRHAGGITEIFLDTDSIGGGEKFAQRIHGSLAQSDLCLVIIGPGWLGLSPGRPPRIMDADDFVRLEVREALATGHRVLPVLCDDAAMPPADQLPADLQPLAGLNAVSIRHTAFERDVAYLLDAIFERRPPGVLGEYFRRHPLLRAATEALAGAAAAFVLLTLALTLLNALHGPALDDLVGGDGPAVIVLLLVLALGAATPAVLRRRGVFR